MQSSDYCEANRLDLRAFMLLKCVKDCSGNPLKKIATKSVPGGNAVIIVYIICAILLVKIISFDLLI